MKRLDIIVGLVLLFFMSLLLLIVYDVHSLIEVAITPSNKINGYYIDLPEDIVPSATTTEKLVATVSKDTIHLQYKHNLMREYQLQVYNTTGADDSIRLWDEDRLVGTMSGIDTTQEINKIIYKDND